MVPITRRASSPNKKCGIFLLIINKPILIRSMLAAGKIQDMFAGEAGEGEGGEEDDWRLLLLLLLLVLLPLRLESLPFLSS